MTAISRRQALTLTAGALGFGLLGACDRENEAVTPEQAVEGEPFEYIDPKLASQKGTIQWAVSGDWRVRADKARDKYRHPIEMVEFFEIGPRSVVLDMWPGAGYMTEILAPFLKENKGEYRAALLPQTVQSDPAIKTLTDRYKRHFGGNKKLYGDIKLTEFGPETQALGGLHEVDRVLFLLVLQDWMAAGIAEKAFVDAFAVLKSGGILGVEQHRSDIGNVQDPAASNGYVQEPFVKQLALEVGFQFAGTSEVNANPKDDKEHPFGVWTLPPQRLTAPRGAAPNPQFDGTLYESIGESDRMLLKFRKP